MPMSNYSPPGQGVEFVLVFVLECAPTGPETWLLSVKMSAGYGGELLAAPGLAGVASNAPQTPKFLNSSPSLTLCASVRGEGTSSSSKGGSTGASPSSPRRELG
jgi:hypothetical protein